MQGIETNGDRGKRGNVLQEFDEIIKNLEFVFEKRTRRPQNYINTLISLGNSILYTTVLSEITEPILILA